MLLFLLIGILLRISLLLCSLFSLPLSSHSDVLTSPLLFSLLSSFFFLSLFSPVGILSYQLDPTVLTQIVYVLLSVLEALDCDLVVIMTTVSSLGLIFNVDGFLDFGSLNSTEIVRIIGILCVLTTSRLNDEETRETILIVMRELLDKLDSSALRNLDLLSVLTGHLSTLWEGSSATSPLRTTIIEVREIDR